MLRLSEPYCPPLGKATDSAFRISKGRTLYPSARLVIKFSKWEPNREIKGGGVRKESSVLTHRPSCGGNTQDGP